MLVRERQVRRDRTVASLLRGAPVAGDALAFGEECHHLGTDAHVKLLFDQRVRHRVVVAFDFHVVINMDPRLFPLGIYIGLRGQRPEYRAVERLQQMLA